MNGDILSVEDMLLKNLPPDVVLLPKDWNGKTTRAYLDFAISRQAVNNKKFDLQGFIKKKFNIALSAIRNRKGVKELRMTQWIRMVIDQNSGHKKTQILIFIEYAKEDEL